MAAEVRKRARCLCCGANLTIPEGAKTVECRYCHEIMEITSFTQEERRLAAAVNEMSRSVKEAEQRMENAIDEYARTGSAAAGELQRQAEAQYEELAGRLEQLRGEYEGGRARKLEGWFRLGENAQHARSYDEAVKYYGNVLAAQGGEAEVHWRRLLCRYGVEYVRDQSSGTYLPTLTKMQVDDILQDADYTAACECARTEEMRAFYEREGRKLDAIIRKYHLVSGSEKPYDVFISVKQGDDEGNMTVDAQIGLELYYTLRERGLNVFNSARSLAGKAGEEYEPYIMHALMSAKLLVVVASNEEYINSRWLKNEWRRFRWLRENEGVQSARRLIVYSIKQGAPLSIPAEIGAMQMINSKSDAEPVAHLCRIAQEMFGDNRQDADRGGAAQTAALLKRMFMSLEDGEFDKADALCERVLDMEPENGRAYLGKLMIELKVRTPDELAGQNAPFDRSNSFRRIMRFGDEALKDQVQGYIRTINERNEYNRRKGICGEAMARLERAQTEQQCREACRELAPIADFEGAKQVMAALDAKIGKIHDRLYAQAMYWKEKRQWQQAIELFQTIAGHRDSKKQIEACRTGMLDERYDAAMALKERGEWQRAIEAFKAITGHRDSKKQIEACRTGILDDQYDLALALKQKQEWNEAIQAFENLGSYRDSAQQAEACLKEKAAYEEMKYADAIALKERGEWDQAIARFKELEHYRDSKEQIAQCRQGVEYAKREKQRQLEEEEKRKIRYEEAVTLQIQGSLKQALQIFKELGDYKDSRERAGEIRAEQKKRQRNLKLILLLLTALLIIVLAGWYNGLLTSRASYQKAEQLLQEGRYKAAIAAFEQAGSYGDADVRIDEAYYCWAEDMLSQGLYEEAIVYFEKAGSYGDAKGRSKEVSYLLQASQYLSDGEYLQALLYYRKFCRQDAAIEAKLESTVKRFEMIAAGSWHTVGLKSDGTVVAVGANGADQCDVSGWSDIVAVSAGSDHTVGLKSDGTVVAVGYNDYVYYGQCDVSGWRDIVAVSAGDYHTVGLKSDGTVVAAGYNDDGQCNVSGWSDIVAVSAGRYHTVGLKADGTVVAVGQNDDGQCSVSGWRDIVAVSAGGNHMVGLKPDGTVIAVGYNDNGQCNVSGWRDIVAVSAGEFHTVGLKSDGTVVAVGSNGCGQCNVSGWRDIVAVSAGEFHTVGLKSDGTVVAAGWNGYGQCDVSGWDLWD